MFQEELDPWVQHFFDLVIRFTVALADGHQLCVASNFEEAFPDGPELGRYRDGHVDNADGSPDAGVLVVFLQTQR